jgi:3D (Asp-Asp-Asp) domain-containing protein
VATGPSYSFGTTLYVPDLAHAPNGGVFTVADRGQGIQNGDMDIFVGAGYGAYKNSATYYFGVGRESAEMRVYQVVLTVDQQFGSMK